MVSNLKKFTSMISALKALGKPNKPLSKCLDFGPVLTYIGCVDYLVFLTLLNKTYG